MGFHFKQTKLELEVESRFKGKIDKLSEFKPSDKINDSHFQKHLLLLMKIQK